MKANIAQRNAAFIKRCCEIMENTRKFRGEAKSLDDVVREALESAPPCHFLSFQRAYNVMLHMLNNELPESITGLRRQMWEEFRQQVGNVMESSHRRRSVSAAVGTVLNFHRPSKYYISHQEARKILKAHLEKTGRKIFKQTIYSWKTQI